MKQKILSYGLIAVLAVILIALCISIFGGGDKQNDPTQSVAGTTESTTITTTASTTLTTTESTTQQSTTETTTSVNGTTQPQQTTTTTTTTTLQNTNNKPQSTKEIIDQYTLLVDKFKKEKPAYKKKEYQALPEEYRNFDKAVNFVLNIAANYMVSEEECEELVRSAGATEIIMDMPIHNSEKGCALTNYDAVSWAKCDDLGDGTYKISFSLKEEVNAEPTPADTLVPVSAHGAVMQPMAFNDIKAEIDNIISGISGISLNQLDLFYRECEFSCIYNPETDEVLSITHHIVIDIAADVKFFSAEIKGTARLLNEMFIYDITW